MGYHMSDSILHEAEKLIYGDRNKAYGCPKEEFELTAKLWSGILGVEVQWHHVPLCMIALKIRRQCHANKRDNLVDIAGYAGTIEMALDVETKQEEQ